MKLFETVRPTGVDSWVVKLASGREHVISEADYLHLTKAQFMLSDAAAHVRGTTEERETYPMPAHGWTCFHCGETFRTAGGARRHFGATPADVAACLSRA